MTQNGDYLQDANFGGTAGADGEDRALDVILDGNGKPLD